MLVVSRSRGLADSIQVGDQRINVADWLTSIYCSVSGVCKVFAEPLTQGGDAERRSGEIRSLVQAVNTDRFNRRLHPHEKKAIADKAGGDKIELDKLIKAACNAVKCCAEFPAGSDAYNANYVGQLEASQLAPELAWVYRQKESGLFGYTVGQKTMDMVK